MLFASIKRVNFERLAVLAALTVLPFAQASASTVYCPEPATGTAQHSLTAPDAYNPSCYAYGDGNPTDHIAPFDSLALLGREDDTYDSPLLNVVSGSSYEGFSVTFSIANSVWSLYDTVVLAAHTGQGQNDPDYVAFKLAPAPGTFGPALLTWTLEQGQNEFSNLSLWGGTPHDGGGGPPNVVPIPAAAPLLASALGVIGLLGRRGRRRKLEDE